jgi:RND family efflux transporter MFP subunit
MRANRCRRSVVALTLLLCAGACGNSPVEAPVKLANPPVVRVVTVTENTNAVEIQGIGTAAWRQETPLGFTSGGQVARIFVNEGDRVAQGQTLAVLSTTPVEAELAAAEAEARRASSDLLRLEGLYRQGWVTKPRFETAQATAAAADAQVRARRFALQTAKVVAPSSGVVLARLAEPTQVVAAGTPVVIIGEASGGYVIRVPLNDRAAAALTVGTPATVRFEALGPAPLAGRIVEIGGKARTSTGTFDVEIALPSDPRLRSGMIGMASLTASGAGTTNRINIPAAALISPRAGEALVYVIDAENRARLRKVAIGETSDHGVDVTSGLSRGERIATSGLDKITDGMRVAPTTRAL